MRSSWLIQVNALHKSVRTATRTLLLSLAYLIFQSYKGDNGENCALY